MLLLEVFDCLFNRQRRIVNAIKEISGYMGDSFSDAKRKFNNEKIVWEAWKKANPVLKKR